MDVWLFTNSHLCQFIEIVHKIINWYMKNANNCLAVLYKHIIQVENKNVGLKVGGHKHTIAPPPNQKRGGGTCAPCPPPPPLPASYASVYINMKTM